MIKNYLTYIKEQHHILDPYSEEDWDELNGFDKEEKEILDKHGFQIYPNPEERLFCIGYAKKEYNEHVYATLTKAQGFIDIIYILRMYEKGEYGFENKLVYSSKYINNCIRRLIEYEKDNQ